MQIWTHPKILDLARKNALFKKMREKARTVKIVGLLPSDEEEEDDGEEENCDEDRECVNSVTCNWYENLISSKELESIESGNKFKLVFEILKECEAKDEKWFLL